MLLALALTWTALDLASFVAMLVLGTGTELNPIVLAIGPVVAVMAKLALIAYLAWASSRLARYRTAVLSTAVLVGLVGATSNLLTI